MPVLASRTIGSYVIKQSHKDERGPTKRRILSLAWGFTKHSLPSRLRTRKQANLETHHSALGFPVRLLCAFELRVS